MDESVIHSERNIGGIHDQMERENDRLFLEDYILKLPQGDIRLHIPNIIKLANNLPSEDKIIELYTNETSTEFHWLLLYLLQQFKAALDELTARYGNIFVIPKDMSGKDPNREETFNKNIYKVHTYGYGLLRLSRGRAFQLHLENIEPLLKAALNLGDEEEDSNGESDVELEEIQPTLPQNGALTKSYTAWLRLMVVSFDATEIVVRAVNKLQLDKVSVTILVPPKTDETLLPWRELFSDQYINPGSEGDNPSNNDIRDFLEKGISRGEVAKRQYELAENALKAWSGRERSQVIKYLEPLAVDQGSDNLSVKDILLKVLEWQTILKQTAEKENRIALSKEISSSIKDLKADLLQRCNRDRFFLKLESMLFTGTVHCETCLASLLPSLTKNFQSDNKYKEMNIVSDLQVEYPHFSLFLSSDPHLFSCI